MSFDILARQLIHKAEVHRITGRQIFKEDSYDRSSNPCGFTKYQCELLAVLADATGMADAAEKLGTSYRSIAMTLMRMRAKTGKTTLQLVVMYDRWARGGKMEA